MYEIKEALSQTIEKNNNIRTVQAEPSKFASLSFDQGFQIVIPPRIVAKVPEPIGTPSDSMYFAVIRLLFILSFIIRCQNDKSRVILNRQISF